jgi:hypothetical protein
MLLGWCWADAALSAAAAGKPGAELVLMLRWCWAEFRLVLEGVNERNRDVTTATDAGPLAPDFARKRGYRNQQERA